MKKIKVIIAGIGSIDKCDCCGVEYTSGVCCWIIDKLESIELCDDCLKNKYVSVNEIK